LLRCRCATSGGMEREIPRPTGRLARHAEPSTC
jgi:hypothetical protein